MQFQAVVFDLDGTLLDTLDDIAAAANRVLAARGYPTHAAQAYRWFVGDGSALLMERTLPPAQRSPQQIHDCLNAFLDDYNTHWDQATQPYAGITELLALLSNRGLQLAVVSNKPHPFTHTMLAHYFGQTDFCFVSGLREGIQKKPDPGQTLAAAHHMGMVPEACLFLGDSAVDMQAALGAGMLPVGAGWGFRTAEELRKAGAFKVITHPMELAELI